MSGISGNVDVSLSPSKVHLMPLSSVLVSIGFEVQLRQRQEKKVVLIESIACHTLCQSETRKMKKESLVVFACTVITRCLQIPVLRREGALIRRKEGLKVHAWSVDGKREGGLRQKSP